MATIINGALIVEQAYEFGIEDLDGKVYWGANYRDTKNLAEALDAPERLRMRAVYKTEWMNAT